MPTHPSTAPPQPPARRIPGPLRRLLRVPLFYKILIANAVLVLAGVVVGSMLTAASVRHAPNRPLAEVAGMLAIVAVVVTVLVNAAILRLALRPLNLLERTAARVQSGDLDARVPLSPVADRELARLTRTFNGMLDAATRYRARLREVASRALTAAEEERKRIARELHDETAQLLAALLIRIRLVRSAGNPEKTDALLEDMRREIGEALEGVRRFARGLRPPQLDELGLVPALEAHVRSLAEISGIRMDFGASEPGPLSAEAELAVYRIVQEALSNVIRHSGASRAEVSLSHDEGWLVAVVRDDGHGFSPEAATSSDGGGLGLFGMQERAAYLGGRVAVRSRPGRGTEVRAEIPLSPVAGAP